MAALDLVLGEDAFSGELKAALEADPLNVGFVASGNLEAAASALRVAAKAFAEAAGKPQPSGYVLRLSTDGGTFDVSFDATAAAPAPVPAGVIVAPPASLEELAKTARAQEPAEPDVADEPVSQAAEPAPPVDPVAADAVPVPPSATDAAPEPDAVPSVPV